MFMDSLLELLKGGDMRSIGRSNLVVAEVLKDRRLFGGLFWGLFDEDPRVRMRAADAVEKVSRMRPQWLKKYKRRLIAQASKIGQQEVRWHVAQMLPRLELDGAEKLGIVLLLSSWLSESESRIVAVNSMQALADLAEKDEKLRPAVVRKIRQAMASGSPAILARGKKLLKQWEASDGSH